MPDYHRICVVILAAFMCLGGCSDPGKRGSDGAAEIRKIKARVAVAGIMRAADSYDATGTLADRTAAVLSSKIMGVILAVHVREGDAVKKGQTLVEIDPRQVQAGFVQAEAALSEARKAEEAAVSARNAAQAGADLAKATYDRYANLMKNESASRQEFDEIRSRFRQAEAALNQSEAMVLAARSRTEQASAASAGARVSQADSRILAPYDGVITSKLADAGSLASPGRPVLKMSSGQGLRADAILPENRLGSVQPAQSLAVIVPSAGNLTLDGRVGAIVPSADPASRSFTIQVDIPAHPGIHPGMFCRVRIPLPVRDALLIPSTALLYQGQLTGIFQVDAGGIARFRILRLGRTSGETAEILSGLKPGDRYVVSPPPDLADGMPVEVQP